MTITEVSEKYGISVDTLRYYEKAGIIPRVTRNKSGIRNYQEEDLQWVQLAIWMRRAGLPIDALAKYVKLSLAGEDTLPQRIELLKKQRIDLQGQLQEIAEAMRILEHKIRKYEDQLKNNT